MCYNKYIMLNNRKRDEMKTQYYVWCFDTPIERDSDEFRDADSTHRLNSKDNAMFNKALAKGQFEYTAVVQYLRNKYDTGGGIEINPCETRAQQRDILAREGVASVESYGIASDGH